MKQSPVVHFEMPAKDRQRVAKFYKESFGWDMQIMGKEMNNYVLAITTPSDDKGPLKPGAINGGFWQSPDANVLPHLVISVENIDEHIQAVKDNGGEILTEKMDIPGVGLYVSFKDSEGNEVGMLQPSNS